MSSELSFFHGPSLNQGNRREWAVWEKRLVSRLGGSIKDLLYQESDVVLRPRPFLVFHDKSGKPKSKTENADSESALLQGDFKLIKTWKNGVQYSVELYNITQDKEEQFDLTGTLPDKTASLGKLLDDYIADVGGDVTIQTD